LQSGIVRAIEVTGERGEVKDDFGGGHFGPKACRVEDIVVNDSNGIAAVSEILDSAAGEVVENARI
jgi:hypothetical protein